MRYIHFLILFIFLTACANEQESKQGELIVPGVKDDQSGILRHPIRDDGTVDSSNLAIMTFVEEIHDFGIIDEGDVVEYSFVFTNTGKAPLLISHARSTCGCTVPEWPKEAIEPGEKGEIQVRFNSDMRPGDQSKPVTIISNTIPNETTVEIRGFVTARD